MIFSQRKAEMMKDRLLMLECMEVMLRNGLIEEAKEMGMYSKIMGDKINKSPNLQ